MNKAKKLTRFTMLLLTTLIICGGGVLISRMPVQATGMTIPEDKIKNEWEWDKASTTLTIKGNGAFTDTELYDNKSLEDSARRMLKSYRDVVTNIKIEMTGNATSIPKSSFRECKQLQTVTFHCTDLKYIKEFSFVSCGIRTISIPDSVTEIKDDAFASCKNLNSVEILGQTDIALTAFWNCNNLSNLTISDKVINLHREIFIYCPLNTINIVSTDKQKTKELIGALETQVNKTDIATGFSTLNIKLSDSTIPTDINDTDFNDIIGALNATSKIKGIEKINFTVPTGTDSAKMDIIEQIINAANLGFTIDVSKEQAPSSSQGSGSSDQEEKKEPTPTEELLFVLSNMSRIASAKEGDTVIIDGRELGIHSYSIYFFKAMLKNQKANVVIKSRYQGVEYEITIPAGANVILNEEIKWYGPLYMASGALGKDVAIKTEIK